MLQSVDEVEFITNCKKCLVSKDSPLMELDSKVIQDRKVQILLVAQLGLETQPCYYIPSDLQVKKISNLSN